MDASAGNPALDLALGDSHRPSTVYRELADGVHYAYQLHADGTLTGFNMAKAVGGKWRTTAEAFCLTWMRPAVAEVCYTVEGSSANVRFVTDGIEIFAGTLAPIKAHASSRGASQ